jgi:putative DNA primase/helicase
LWRAHLKRIRAGDDDLQWFLQRMFGYCLTGSTNENAMFFCYGLGGNGKGVCFNAVVGIWGDYARITPMATFVEAKGERHPTELAALMGARLATANETEKGRYWAEAKLKWLTGGDKLSARFMHGDYFDFQPD